MTNPSIAILKEDIGSYDRDVSSRQTAVNDSHGEIDRISRFDRNVTDVLKRVTVNFEETTIDVTERRDQY